MHGILNHPLCVDRFEGERSALKPIVGRGLLRECRRVSRIGATTRTARQRYSLSGRGCHARINLKLTGLSSVKYRTQPLNA
jgi:hypothetical protein